MAANKTIKGRVTCKVLNFRSEPNKNNKNIIAKLNENDIVRIFDETDPNFYKVRFTNKNKKVITGYVMKIFIEKLAETKK